MIRNIPRSTEHRVKLNMEWTERAGQAKLSIGLQKKEKKVHKWQAVSLLKNAVKY